MLGARAEDSIKVSAADLQALVQRVERLEQKAEKDSVSQKVGRKGALTRGPIMDGAGANAIWNITNVTRSDRKSHYLDLNGTIYADYASKDPEAQAASGTEEEIYK